MRKLNITLFLVLFLANSILYYLYLLPTEGFLYIAAILVLSFLYDIYKDSKEEKWLKPLITWAKKNKIKSSDLPRNTKSLLKLEVLNLRSKNLTEVPEEISNLVNLRILLLDDNKLTKLPSGICKLTNLHGLSVNNNQLTRLPHCIDKLQNLQSLRLSNNKLTSTPKVLARLNNLSILDLDGNKINLDNPIRQSPEMQSLNYMGANVGPGVKGITHEEEMDFLRGVANFNPVKENDRSDCCKI